MAPYCLAKPQEIRIPLSSMWPTWRGRVVGGRQPQLIGCRIHSGAMAVDTQVMPKAMEAIHPSKGWWRRFTVASAGRGEFSCAACGEFFATAAELRAHCKSERHEAWERKLREREGQENTKGTAHLKAGKAPHGKAGADFCVQAAPEAMVFSPRRCLFDKQRFSSVEKNLQHMSLGEAAKQRSSCSNG
eukprot:Skav226012  [mRNA]  locus=scaffold1010:233789:237502:+ [translate_table: standard]